MSGPVELQDCPVGLFRSEAGVLCLKTEYTSARGKIEAYIVESGEAFWGGASTPEDQRRVLVTPVEYRPSFQDRAAPWMQDCFGSEVAADRLERGDRHLEEVLELLQSGGYPPERVAALTTYVYARPAGEPAQEVGGVMLTLAAYCNAHGLDMHAAGDAELARVSTPEMIARIRAKQAAKPHGSALPVAHPAHRPISSANTIPDPEGGGA